MCVELLCTVLTALITVRKSCQKGIENDDITAKILCSTLLNSGPAKTPTKEAPKEILENVFNLQWHSIIALGVFVGVYLKCTSASIPSGDAG